MEKPVEFEKELIIAVKSCERQTALQKANEIFDVYANNGLDNSNQIKMEVLELVLLLTRSIEESGGGSCETFNNSQRNSFDRINRCDTIDELKEWFAGFIDLCISEYDKLKLGRSAAVADKVREYIEESLENEDFSLDMVAGKLYMSPNYLRHIFKQQTGSSFVDYLTAKRMERAASLLQARVLKVQEIAEKVGYGNQRYFASCFKKHYGLTPSEFRESQMSDSQ